MILSEKLLALIKQLSDIELNDEDKLKWQSAYLEIFEKGYFTVSRDNIEKILSTHPIDSPFTTYGEIVLIKHIKRINLDQRQLKKTVEIAVRFLDGCLEIANFTPEAKKIVQAFRKIGLGVADFDNYSIQINQDQSAAIIIIGDIISYAAYRSSELLGIERGFVSDLENSKVYNRGKSFASFVNKETGVLINGLSLKKLVYDSKASWDEYSILQRRNTHILLLPNQEIWFPYTDRVEGDSMTIENNTPTNQKFTKGELVTITDNKHEYFNKTFQIIDYKPKQGKINYVLRNEEQELKIELSEEFLGQVELQTILRILNTTTSSSNDQVQINNINLLNLDNQNGLRKTNINIIGFILNNNDRQVLVDKSSREVCNFNLSHKLLPESGLIEYIKNNYGLECEILDEIGSVVNSSDVILGYWLNIVGGVSTDLEWVDIEHLDNNESVKRLLLKLNRKKKIYTQYEDIIKQLEIEKTRILTEQSKAKSILVVHERPKQNLTLNERINTLFGKKSKPKEYLRLGGSNKDQTFDYDDSRYLLSLQQNLITEEFGTVKLIMEYSKNGVKSIQLYPEFFKSEERFILDLFLDLVNTCLVNNVTKFELSKIMYKYERELVVSSMVEVIKLIRHSLNSSPDNFNDLSNKVY